MKTFTLSKGAPLMAGVIGLLCTEVRAETWEDLHAKIQPASEPWTTIPWQSSLVPAQQLAVAEGKPLFIWAMDGHPLGCT